MSILNKDGLPHTGLLNSADLFSVNFLYRRSSKMIFPVL